jgi:hypothetical protein
LDGATDGAGKDYTRLEGVAAPEENRRHLFTEMERRSGVAAMRQGNWGRVQRAIRWAFTAEGNRPLSTMQLVAWAYPRVRAVQCWHRQNVRRAVSRVATRIGRRNPGGLLWRLK